MLLVKYFIIALVFVAITAGCAPMLNDDRYYPSIVMSGKGSVAVRKFTYNPHNKVSSNEIYYNSGIGSILNKNDIDYIYTEAIKSELKFIGYTLNDQANIAITGEIIDLSANSLGFSNVDFYTKIKFILIKETNNKQELVFSKVYENKSTVHKRGEGGVMSHFYIGLADCIKDFLKDVQEKNLL